MKNKALSVLLIAVSSLFAVEVFGSVAGAAQPDEGGHGQPLRVPRPAAAAAAPQPAEGSSKVQMGKVEMQDETPSQARQGAATEDEAPPLAPQRASVDESGAGQPAKPEPFRLNARKTGLSGETSEGQPLSAAVVERARLLSQYQIELIIDRSFSMRRRDCPGHMSRWKWCGAQADELARELSPFAQSGLTITTFAWGYKVYENADPAVVSQIFTRSHLGPGTRMGEPLSDRIKNYLGQSSKTAKPLLIGVITDGVPVPPYEPHMVSSTLISASKNVSDPRALTVVFFQVGGSDPLGRFFLSRLDHGLVGHGASYDIARTVSFDQLRSEGLAQALADSIQRFSAAAGR